MIFGIGTDVCDLRRLRATWERRGERFAQRVLGPHEIEVFRDRLAKVAESLGEKASVHAFAPGDPIPEGIDAIACALPTGVDHAVATAAAMKNAQSGASVAERTSRAMTPSTWIVICGPMTRR